MSNKVNFSMGTDPEFMLKNGNEYKSAIGIIQGSKTKPLIVEGNAIFYDNVLVECAVPCANNRKDFLINIKKCLQIIANMVKPLKIIPQASHTYPLSECQHPAAKEFGCSEEFNAYEMSVVPAPHCEEGNTFRTGGGHIHVGYVSGAKFPLIDEDDGRWWMTRYMDFFVGLASLIMDTDPTSPARRKLYGGAGNMRPKEYGLEYRTLSNFWLMSPLIVNQIWNLVEFTLGYVQNNQKNLESFWMTYQKDVRDVINAGDVKNGTKLFGVIAKEAKMPDIVSVLSFGEYRYSKWNFYEQWGIKTD